MEVIITKHASQRMKERMNIKSGAKQRRMAELAISRGKCVEIQEWEDSHGPTMLVEFNKRVFVYGIDKALITVMYARKYREGKEGLLSHLYLQEAKKEMAYA